MPGLLSPSVVFKANLDTKYLKPDGSYGSVGFFLFRSVESEDIKMDYRIQMASDLDRDGMALELIDQNDDVLAEVFSCDKDHTVVLNTFKNDLPITALSFLLRSAMKRLDTFEDGTPFDWESYFKL